jgi:hypothetical protein
MHRHKAQVKRTLWRSTTGIVPVLLGRNDLAIKWSKLCSSKWVYLEEPKPSWGVAVGKTPALSAIPDQFDSAHTNLCRLKCDEKLVPWRCSFLVPVWCRYGEWFRLTSLWIRKVAVITISDGYVARLCADKHALWISKNLSRPLAIGNSMKFHEIPPWLSLTYITYFIHTVDGRNPASLDGWNMLKP